MEVKYSVVLNGVRIEWLISTGAIHIDNVV